MNEPVWKQCRFHSNINELLEVIFRDFYCLNLAKYMRYLHKEVEPAPFSVNLKYFIESSDWHHSLQNITQIKIEG